MKCSQLLLCTVALLVSQFPARASESTNPNFIFIFADDLGYADVGCFGAKNIRTPRLDQLARKGMKLTSFYAQAVCGPSRGALMTGRYPNRIGGGRTTLAEEVTVAEVLKQAGYATGCIGKWDISGRRYVEGQVPNDQGFDCTPSDPGQSGRQARVGGKRKSLSVGIQKLFPKDHAKISQPS